jgi:hypothetical protein
MQVDADKLSVLEADTIPCGDCFRFANNLSRTMLDEGVIPEDDIHVVHAVVREPPPSSSDKRFAHAWVEAQGRAYDWQMQHGPGSLPIDTYYELRQPSGVNKYPVYEAMARMVKNQHHGPWESIRDRRARELLEFTYKDFRGGVDWDFINMKKHAAEAKKRGVQYVPYSKTDPTSGSNGQFIFFKSPLSPRSKARGYTQDAWYQTIKMIDFQEALESRDVTMFQKVNLMVSGDIALHCTCPAFNWWGYRYIVTQLDAAIYPQPEEPDTRNPRQRGIICKHLETVLSVLPFWMSDVTRDLQAQGFEEETQEETEDEESPEAAR